LKVEILYDNEALPGFDRGWGFSCLVDLTDEKILFDTGWDGRVLLSNMRKLGEDPQGIDRIVLSHPHWDHIGGLVHLQARRSEVWVPSSFSKNLRAEMAKRWELHEVRGSERIRRGVWTTGELGRTTKEQSMVVDTDHGLLVIVGCSHPGVRNILSAASEFGDVWGIVGGMHGFDDYAVLKGMGLIIPTHCTVNKEKIARLFPESTKRGGAGLELEIE